LLIVIYLLLVRNYLGTQVGRRFEASQCDNHVSVTFDYILYHNIHSKTVRANHFVGVKS